MREEQRGPETGGAPAREPILLLPGVIGALCALLVVVHLAQTFALNPTGRIELLYHLSFIAMRLPLAIEDAAHIPPLVWTSLTHAFLHAGWEHLLINTAWLAVFGTPVARRYGAVPTLLVFGLGAMAGAFAFALANMQSPAYLIGASGGVSALTGAAIRFMFQPVLVGRHPETGEPVVLGRRLLSLGGIWTEPRARAFALIWVGLNAAIPLVPLFTGGDGLQIAWEAHLGGFFAGLLLVGLFERRPPAQRP